jgi:hypothetical protein
MAGQGFKGPVLIYWASTFGPDLESLRKERSLTFLNKVTRMRRV